MIGLATDINHQITVCLVIFTKSETRTFFWLRNLLTKSSNVCFPIVCSILSRGMPYFALCCNLQDILGSKGTYPVCRHEVKIGSTMKKNICVGSFNRHKNQ